MLGIKSQPLDDGEVPLFMSFCSCHRGGAKWFPLLAFSRSCDSGVTKGGGCLAHAN